jgi:hypothetical protein
MADKILLVNPPIYDFTAYDFWLKPYGLLSAASRIGGDTQFILYDHLDRLSPDVNSLTDYRPKNDAWSRGPFYARPVASPSSLSNIRRTFRRFGTPRKFFQQFLAENVPSDFAFVQTQMTYWYLGVEEVISDIRRFWPATKIVLGGTYASICPEHAHSLGADLVVQGSDFSSLYKMLNAKEPSTYQPPLWQLYDKLKTGVMKLTQGCPFACTYCATGQNDEPFTHRRLPNVIADFHTLIEKGTVDIAFYDDALLYKPEVLLAPFLEHVISSGKKINFHTPNALHARYINEPVAELMVAAGFKTFYLGFESASETWQKQTGAKVAANDLAKAVSALQKAGADSACIIAYNIVGHPDMDSQNISQAMHFAHSLGIRTMLSDFSPIPGTPDGERCRLWTDLDEPLNHNKTAFPIHAFGEEKINELKNLCRSLNQRL